MKTIPLTQGKFAIVDDEDFEWLSHWKWMAVKGGKTWYATRTLKQIRMHREIVKCHSTEIVDHINRNGLDNRRENLRVCNAFESGQNRGLFSSNKSSKYKGVSWHVRCNKWEVQIVSKGKSFYIGLFDNEEDAAIAHDVAAQIFHREFAYLNFPHKK